MKSGNIIKIPLSDIKISYSDDDITKMEWIYPDKPKTRILHISLHDIEAIIYNV
jgi:hypothetical protein